MKVTYQYIRLSLLAIILSCNCILAQKVTIAKDNSVLYYFMGKGYIESGVKKQIVFTDMGAHATHNVSNIILENNNIIIGKTGTYKLSLSCEEGLTKKQKKVIYSVTVNNNEISNLVNVNTNAEERYNTIQLKKGDILAFNIVSIQDPLTDKNTITNTLKLRAY
ncbi:hypothetical protein [Chryseobacterium potabilaquae]|uniref:Uncharacterized protein n=1 Tax=Chryseobacterium potabilaquae TaxID=2675057 RepID=A0A6N4X8J3_9FLAO|nr:hypothetical protein [Chryseobacterium potabilaquae]CAA7197332.1 hypothetical protein CHRY9293_03387 [Chryseobacterium potabilaquae]